MGSWAIERDEATGKPYMVRHYYRHGRGTDSMHRYPVADREAGALRRLKAIVDARNARSTDAVVSYHQTDPRGCALYLLRRSDIPEMTVEQVTRHSGPQAAETPESRFRVALNCYYTRGLAVCA